MKKVLSFDDTLILPRFSEIRTRKECDTTVDLNGLVLKTPIISANMDTITGVDMAKAMSSFGGIGCLHRFYDPVENGAEYLKVINTSYQDSKQSNCIVSVGITEDERHRFNVLAELGAKYFIIDVANGASQAAVNMYVYMRQRLGDAWIAVGNFGDAQSYLDFQNRVTKIGGSLKMPNAVKVGIGGGSMCTTRIVTGCGLPTLASILDFGAYIHDGTKIIADGGIKNSGDIAKALAAGADAVMVGSLLAGTDETPGEVFSYGGNEVAKYRIREETNTKVYDRSYIASPLVKKYRGSASAESYEVQGKTANHRTAEGASTLIPYKGPVEPILQQLTAGLQSAMSYVNAFTVDEFKENSELVEISSSGMAESKPHGVK